MTSVNVETTGPSAFLALDFTTFIVEHFSSDPRVVDRAADALQLARTSGVPVFHVVPEPMRDDIHPTVAPHGDEVVLGKTSIGAFASTELHDLLHGQGIARIVVAGVATSGTVLSTTRWAHDMGYDVTICLDACADPDAGAHAALTDPTVFPQSWLGLWRMADVRPAAEIPALNPT